MEEDIYTEKIIGCSIEVQKALGPGLLENAYGECLFFELLKSGLNVQRQFLLPLIYKNVKMNCAYKIDLFIEQKVILEIKTVDKIMDVHKAQLMTYMKLANVRIGLLLNFNVKYLKDGIVRWIIK